MNTEPSTSDLTEENPLRLRLVKLCNCPWYYTIRFEELPKLLYVGKSKRPREERFSEHSASFVKQKAAPLLQELYDKRYRVIYKRITFHAPHRFVGHSMEEGERYCMKHAAEKGFTLLNTMSMQRIKTLQVTDYDNCFIDLNLEPT